MPEQFVPLDAQKFEEALRRFDAENGRDPNLEEDNGVSQPRELLYAKRVSDWVLRLCPAAGEELRLAARCQHLCRWMIARDSFPMTRVGYLQWREELKKFHAKKAGEILREIGYPELMISRVQALNLKKNFPNDPEGRVLEDALCLVFLEHQFGALAEKTSEDKMINALQKSWKKMTPAGRSHAKQLTYSAEQNALLTKAFGALDP